MKRTSSYLVWVVSGLVIAFVARRGISGGLSDLQHKSNSLVNVDLEPMIEELESSITASLSGENCAEYGKYALIYQLLEDNYYDSELIDIEQMRENALKWFVDALGDPYTVYLTNTENELFDEELQWTQNFEGIGAVVVKKDNGILIEELIKGGPAFKAGIKPLDLILEVDGEPTEPLSLHEAVMQIRGPKWTEVILTIFREQANEVLEVPVVRDEINVPSVRSESFSVSWADLQYIEVAVFGNDTKRSFADAVDQVDEQTDGLILDLRGNGGGYLPIAVDLASFFVDKGEVVTTARYTTFPEEVYTSKGYGGVSDIPVVVLIDGISASASEILAAALDEHIWAVLMGTQTFGKWSIQTLFDLQDGSTLKYTIGKWYTPTDENIDREGLQPDIVVEFDGEGYASGAVDNQLEAAKAELVRLLDQP